MSLFQVCQYWSTQLPENEKKFDSNSLHCCRLALEENEKDFIIVGSHSGHLCVYQPKIEKLDDGTVTGFKPTSVVLETKLSLPIIGIQSGKFSNASNVWSNLAILHPMKISVYTIIKTSGVAEHGDQSKLQLVYEHNLKKSAFSICKGNFGGGKGREFLCVLHMDGSLKFFEHDGIAFECQLPDERTIPSPISYISRIDSFVTITPGWDVECYRYQDLTQSNEESDIIPMWTYCIGESPIDFTVHQISNSETVMVILGEHNLYCLGDNGKSKFIKRLDYTAVCFCSFVIGWYWEPDARLMIAIVSDSGSLVIYENMNVIWSAKLTEVPVAIQRANLQDLPGAIVTLGEEGNLSAGYLGSEPQMFQVPPLNLSDMNYEKCQREMQELEKEIKKSVDVTDISLVNAAAERELQVNIVINPKLENSKFNSTYSNADSTEIPKMCFVNVHLKSQSNIDRLQVYFKVNTPMKCSTEITTFRDLDEGNVENVTSWVYMDDNLDPYDINITILISFINKQGILRVIEKQNPLPLEMFWKSATPQKEANFKVTISLEKSTINLSTIFKEFNLDASTQAIGLISAITKSIVTIVQAKSTSRYRIQSDNLFSISSIFSIIIERLQNPGKDTALSAKEKSRLNNNNGNIQDINLILKTTTNSPLPMDEILKMVEKHYSARQNIKKLQFDLESRCGQMRLIERRLLVKIQDRAANALGGITQLLKTTYTNLTENVMKIKEAQEQLKRSQHELSSVIALLVNYVRFLELPLKTVDGFIAGLLCPVVDYSEQSWEETISASLEFLNYSGPLRKNKNSTLDEHPTLKVTEIDLNRFKHQIQSLYDRICRMATQSTTNSTSTDPFSSHLTDTKLDDSTKINETTDENLTSLKNTTTITTTIPENDEEENEEKSDWINDDILTADILQLGVVV